MSKEKKSVLIIEDDPDLTQILAYNLKKAGYEVLTAGSGVQAIWKIVEKERPNCILLDLMMPSPDGYELCDFIKSSEDYREIPVIIISARSEPQDMERALNLGADVYLKKPFPMQSLIGILQNYSTPRGEIRFPPP